jgi:hypothetical protein
MEERLIVLASAKNDRIVLEDAMNDEPENEEEMDDDARFLAKYGDLIDSLIDTDVSTKESFNYMEMAEDAEVFSAMDIERVASDLFATRLRYALSVIAMNVISSISKPRLNWKSSMKGIRAARAKLDVMISLMECMNDQAEGDE